MSEDIETRSGGESGTGAGGGLTNVIPIEKGKKKGKTIGVMGKIMPYVDALLELPSRDFDLPGRYGIAKLKGQAKILVEIDPEFDVLTPTDKEEVADCFMRYSKNKGGMAPLDPEHANKAVRFWRANTKPIEADAIAPVRELTEKGYCWHRLPFDFKPMPTPTFDELFSRVENGLAVKEWIGALLDPKAERQHYVWFHGPGGQGKGALSRCLSKVFGPSYRSEITPNEKHPDRFWTYGLIGSRLVVFPDCKDPNFPATGLGKSLTGGDPIRVEEKGGKVATAELACMLMFMSQEKPQISSEKSDTRRIIYAQVKGLDANVKPIPEADYDASLWREAPGFLAECQRLYQAMKKRGTGYALDAEALAELVAENEMPLEAFFDTYFEIDNTYTEVERERPCVLARDFQTILKVGGRWTWSGQQAHFLSWLKRKHGLSSKIVKLGEGKTERRYIGVKLTRQGQALAMREERPEF
jgi:hypothetical protein